MKLLTLKNFGAVVIILVLIAGVVYVYQRTNTEDSVSNPDWAETVWEENGRKIEIEYDYDTLSATLRAEDDQGREVRAETGYGIDSVVPAEMDSNRFMITAIGRESDRVVDFDLLQEVIFSENGPTIQTVVEGPAFGGYFEQDIVYILETEDMAQLTVIVHPEYEWNFGKEITKRGDWKQEYWLAGVQLLSEHEFIAEFGGNCEGDGKPPICGRYLISTIGKTISPLPLPPSTLQFYSVGDKVGSFTLKKLTHVNEELGGGYQAEFTGTGRVTGTLLYEEGVFTGWHFIAETPSMLPNARANYYERTPRFVFDVQSEAALDARFSREKQYHQTIEINGFKQDMRPMETTDVTSLVRVIQSEPIELAVEGEETGVVVP